MSSAQTKTVGYPPDEMYNEGMFLHNSKHIPMQLQNCFDKCVNMLFTGMPACKRICI